MVTPPPLEELDALTELIFSGRKIQAIKLYRTLTGAGLKEAKHEIEAMEALLRIDSPGKFASKPKTGGCLPAMALFLCCGFGFGSAVAYWVVHN